MSSVLINPVLIASLASAAALVFVAALGLLSQPDPVRVRLAQLGGRPHNLEELEMAQPFSDRILRPALRGVSQLALSMTPQSTIDKIRHQLILAGSPGGMDVRDFLGLKGLVALLVALLGAMAGRGPGGLVGSVFFGGIGLMIGYLLPEFWLGGRVRSRQREMTRTLPDALDLLTISVEAGLGFDAALLKVVEKWDNALSAEFNRALGEIRMGKSRRDALRAMVARTEVPDVATFIAAVIQADQLGVSISRVLHSQADQMRIRRRQRAEELAYKAPIKMLFPMIFLIFPALFVVILGPAIPALTRGF